MTAADLQAPPTLLIVAAGTGGHVMPGLAVAQVLRGRGWRVRWLGSQAGMERSLVEAAGLSFDAVDFSNMRGKGPVAFVGGIYRLAAAFHACLRILRRTAPHAVFTTGGYIAVPAGLAAAWQRRPLLFLNADAAPQLSLRVLRRFVRLVLCGFEGATARLAGVKACISGAPVRAEIAALPDPAQRLAQRTGNLRLLVLGGSLGARVLNETVPAALAQIDAAARPGVVHQCGAGHAAATEAAYRERGIDARVVPFVADVAAEYAWADVVLCRAGAITVSELCAAGVGAILVPLLASTTAHQRANAELLAARGAAVHLPQGELNAQSLARTLLGLSRARLLQMACSARALARPDAAAVVAAAIERVALPGLAAEGRSR